jgi:hypothetical protein
MKTYDFINSNVGNKLYITRDGDLFMNSRFRYFVHMKTEFTLIRLTSNISKIINKKLWGHI